MSSCASIVEPFVYIDASPLRSVSVVAQRKECTVPLRDICGPHTDEPASRITPYRPVNQELSV